MQPPSLQQAESQVIEKGPSADFVEQQHALVLQYGLCVAQGFFDVGCRMQNVGGNGEVIMIGRD